MRAKHAILYRGLILGLLVLVIGVFSAAAQDAVELRWLSHTFEPWNVALQAHADEYMEANPGVGITYSHVIHADLNVEIATALAGGDPPTIMGVYGPWMPQLLEAGALAAVPQWVIEDLDNNFPPVMKEAATYDGNVYGYVQHIGIPMPIINPVLLETYELAAPTTWDEVLELDNALEAEGLYGLVLTAVKDGSWNVIHWSSILQGYGGRILTEDLSAAAFNDEAGLSASNVFAQLAQNAEIDPGDAFMLEFSAMSYSGPWMKSAFNAEAPDLVYEAILPLVGGAQQATSAYVWFWVVSSAASPEEQEAAWQFLSWASNGEQYADLYREIGLLPITNEIPTEFEDDSWVQTFSQGLQNAFIYYEKHPAWEQIDLAIGEELERLAVGEVTAQEFLDTAEARVNDILDA